MPFGTGAFQAARIAIDGVTIIENIITGKIQAQQTLAHIDTTGQTSGTATPTIGYVYAFQVTATASGALTSVGLDVVNAAGNIDVAIYTDSAGAAGTLIAHAAAAVAAATGWNDIPVTGLNVVDGGKYWLAFQNDTGTLTIKNAGFGGSNCVSYAESTFGTWIASPTWGSTNAFKSPNLRMTYNITGVVITEPGTGGGTTTLLSANTGATNYAITFPAYNDTVALLGYSGVQGFQTFQVPIYVKSGSLGSVLVLYNPANTNYYQINTAAIAGNYNLSLPLITGNDTLASLGLLQTFTAGLATGAGGTAPASWTPGATTVATVVSSTQNVILICTAIGTQSANGQINGTDIGATWAAGQVIPLKKGDTVTWTGTAAPTFIVMSA